MTGARESGSPRAPATAALGAVFLATGLGFGLTAALVCGLGLLVMVVGAVSWVELSTRGGRLERERGPGRIDERDPYPLRLRLSGTLLPPPGGELRDSLLERPVPVGPRWRRRLARDVWLDGPGRRRLGAAHLTVRDPLGLWRRELRSFRSDDLVVLPRVEPVRWGEGGTEAGGRSDGSGSASDANSRRGGLAQFEVDGLRPYRDGSPAARIHWPAVARTGEMLERRLIAGGDPRPLVVFEPRGAADRAERERAMRAAASLCVALARAGGCDLLLPGERRPLTIDSALRSWPEAHTRIALADPRAGVGSAGGLRGAVVFWVTAGRALPASVRRLHPGSLLITPHGSRKSASFRVSGCFAYPAGASARRARPRRAAA
jgi:uncharacterized protein (DUF58 family)